MHQRWVAALTVLCVSVVRGNELSVGDAAPKLQVKEFVKGDPVKSLEKGKTYVVEFWATWCGPCRATIPHLTELQKKYKDVTFIGVSVSEQDQSAVKPFVEEMGAKMDYRVALDDVAAEKEGAMSKNWMSAANQNGIPTAFIVNGDSKIVWIGHPVELEKPLAKVVAGNFDVQTAIAEFKKEAAQKKKMASLRQKLVTAMKSNDPAAALGVIDQAIADDASLEEMLGGQKFQLLTQSKEQTEQALAYGKKLVEQIYKDNANALNQIAWNIVDPDAKAKLGPAFCKLALQAAEQADKLENGKSPAVADTLAKAYFDCGDVAKAIKTQERAVERAKGTQFEADGDLKTRLEQYRKAAAEKK